MRKLDELGNKKLTILNVFFSVLLEIVAILHGFIIPRIILGLFGSEVNGLTSSLNQFLNYITLLEGGLIGVVSAALYKPLNEKDYAKVSAIYVAADRFLKKIALIYVLYAVVVAGVYPLIFDTGFSWSFVFELTLIIASTKFIQYCFSLSLRTIINADKKVIIISAVSIAIYIGNLICSLVVVKFFPSILLLKAMNGILFLFQPIAFNAYVKKHYKIDKHAEPDNKCLSQRWDGFGHNTAYFIHSNTDVMLLTVFSTLANVSVYNVYLMVVTSLKTFVTSVSKAITPTLGSILAGDNEKARQNTFDTYSFVMNTIASFVFTCGAILITSFVSVYTAGITDADYHQTGLGIMLMLAEGVACIRTPYTSAADVSGHYRQTAKYAWAEAAINIVLSIVLYQFFGIVGIAIGTFAAMTYRATALVFYLRKNILHRSPAKAFRSAAYCAGVFAFSFVTSLFIKVKVDSYLSWFLYALIIAAITGGYVVLFAFLIDRSAMKTTLKMILGKKK